MTDIEKIRALIEELEERNGSAEDSDDCIRFMERTMELIELLRKDGHYEFPTNES